MPEPTSPFSVSVELKTGFDTVLRKEVRRTFDFTEQEVAKIVSDYFNQPTYEATAKKLAKFGKL